MNSYISMGILHFEASSSKGYYVKYVFPSGHYWDIDYLGPTKKKVLWWWEPTGPPIAAFVLRE